MYFNQFATPGQVKSEWRRLCFIYHPDIGGNTATMQTINAEYHDTLQALNGHTSIGGDNKEHTYRYSREVEQEVMDKVAELLNLKMANVEVELIGTWIWIYGDTRPHKEELKALKCRWHGKRKKWYWRRFTYRRKQSNLTFGQMRRAFGSQQFEQDTERAIATV